MRVWFSIERFRRGGDALPFVAIKWLVLGRAQQFLLNFRVLDAVLHRGRQADLLLKQPEVRGYLQHLLFGLLARATADVERSRGESFVLLFEVREDVGLHRFQLVKDARNFFGAVPRGHRLVDPERRVSKSLLHRDR